MPAVELEGLSSPEVLEHTAAEGRVLVTATLQACRRPSRATATCASRCVSTPKTTPSTLVKPSALAIFSTFSLLLSRPPSPCTQRTRSRTIL